LEVLITDLDLHIQHGSSVSMVIRIWVRLTAWVRFHSLFQRGQERFYCSQSITFSRYLVIFNGR